MSAPEAAGAGAAGEASIEARMERMYRPQKLFYDLTRKYYLIGRDQLVAGLKAPAGARVLEVGCGTGRNLQCMAKRYPGIRAFGLDAAEAMLEQGRRRLPGVRFERGNAETFDPVAVFGEQAFERIVFSYTLSMMDNPLVAVDHALGLLAPGGSVHIVDFGDQAEQPRWMRGLLQWWLQRFHVAHVPALDGHLRTRARERGIELQHERMLRGYADRYVLS